MKTTRRDAYLGILFGVAVLVTFEPTIHPTSVILAACGALALHHILEHESTP